ncbi:hypothetical protein [Fictibacillus nanhaiensis]|uniref:hypothetical protein n=1 Tax=Fictibacillus nanhaiensis TaxID=742169 RepID=UPI003C147409
MIPFVLLFTFTLIAGTVLYFYPPNIPLKLKMTLLGLAFLLALGGLFVLDNLSYGLALAAIMAIAFVTSYVAEKRMNLMPATAGQTEIVLSFTEEKPLRERKSEDLEHKTEVLEPESAETVDELQEIEEFQEVEGLLEVEEMTKQEVLIDMPHEELDSTIQAFESLDVIDLLDLDLDENVLENDRNVVLEIAESVVEPPMEVDVIDGLAELTDDEFAFLTETREISEDVTELPVVTDIDNVDIFLQRSALLEELDEEEWIEELPLDEEPIATKDIVEENAEVILNNDEEVLEEAFVRDLEVDATNEMVMEAKELSDTEQDHFVEKPIIEEHLLEEQKLADVNPEHFESTVEEIDIAEWAEEINEMEEDGYTPESTLEEQTEEQAVVQAADEFEPVNETESEGSFAEEAESEHPAPDMNAEVQDMLLSTLNGYQEQADDESYQVMLHTIWNQTLSDKDYYLFGKLLLDSYVAVDERSRVSDLLDGMEGRLQSYPVIAEELKRYRDTFLVKQ